MVLIRSSTQFSPCRRRENWIVERRHPATVRSVRTFLFWSLLLSKVAPCLAQSFNDFDLPPHDYYNAKLNDPMTQLVEKVGQGKVDLGPEPGKDRVQRLLDALEVPVESQVLVFTKTSLQRRVVNPKNPRAIFFNEDSYVGWMPNGRIEVASFDPKVGPVFFYERPLDERDGPMFTKPDSCIGCHAGSAANFMPGLLGRSVFPDPTGRNLKSITSADQSGHEVPFHDRWGGWYVTGQHGGLRHMGNAFAKRQDKKVTIEREQHANIKRLNDYINVDDQLTTGSDVLALMILDHQIGMHDRLIEAHYRVRHVLHEENLLDHEDTLLTDEANRVLAKEADRVLRYLLFHDEQPLAGDRRVSGHGAFEGTFLANRNIDRDGRSLKDLQLIDHMFKYRCSYMIYSKSFQGLPTILKGRIYRDLAENLISASPTKFYQQLEAEERRAIFAILKATLPEFVTHI